MQSSKESSNFYSSFDQPSSPCPTRFVSSHSLPPASQSSPSSRRFAVEARKARRVQAGVLEGDGRHSEVMDGVEASPLCQRPARRKVSSFRQASGRRVLLANGHRTQCLSLRREAEVHRKLHGAWQFVGTAQQLHADAFV